MKKDVIYVDIEDDITSIIEKVKSSESRIVALVPPKRIGVLQSVVNLKLLQRAAKSADKRVVMITNNSALSALAAGVAMPVAKNLQSKPELAPAASSPTDDEDIINGAELPVGDHAAAAGMDTSDDTDVSLTSALGAIEATEQTAAAKAAAKAPKKKTSKVPNFDSFRKKLFLFSGLGILLVAFLVWAIFFASKATVEIAAKTNPVNINKMLTLKDGATVDPNQNLTPYVSEQTKKTQSTEFTATGKKDVGEKATGVVEFSTDSISRLGTTIPAGTELTSSDGMVYLTDESVTMTFDNFSGATTGITAAENGEDYNGAEGEASGAPDGIRADIVEKTAGGTTKMVTVVSQDDVNRAREELKNEDINKLKEELAGQFDDDVVIIMESLQVKSGDPSVSPGVGQEAAKAQVAVETTYTLYGIERSDIKTIFDDYLRTQMSDEESQKIYASGDNDLQFSEFSKQDGGFEVRAQATGRIGPQIDETALKQQIVGKRAGEVREIIESIDGVNNVETKFWPFWVSKTPEADKITIKFILEDEQ